MIARNVIMATQKVAEEKGYQDIMEFLSHDGNGSTGKN